MLHNLEKEEKYINKEGNIYQDAICRVDKELYTN